MMNTQPDNIAPIKPAKITAKTEALVSPDLYGLYEAFRAQTNIDTVAWYFTSRGLAVAGPVTPNSKPLGRLSKLKKVWRRVQTTLAYIGGVTLFGFIIQQGMRR